MNRIFNIAGVTACLLTVLIMSGGHWAVFQSFAWMRMTIEFSRQDGWSVAIQKTFSGRHPCNLCFKVREGMQAEQGQEQKAPRVEFQTLPEIVWEWRAMAAPPVPTFTAPGAVFAPEFFSDFSDCPPTPPPRA